MDSKTNPRGGAVPIRVGMTLAEAQNLLIAATLRATAGNIARAAGILGIDRTTLYARIRKNEIKWVTLPQR